MRYAFQDRAPVARVRWLAIGVLCAAGCVRHQMAAPEPWERDGVRISVSGRAQRTFCVWTIRGTASNRTGEDVSIALTLRLIDRSGKTIAEVPGAIERLRAGRESGFEAMTLAPIDVNGATSIVPGDVWIGPPRN